MDNALDAVGMGNAGRQNESGDKGDHYSGQ
jgi:hypothetical protein